MAIQLVKESIRTDEVICQKNSQTMVESDVIVPDVKPDILKVLEVSGSICITQKTVQQDKVFVQGVVKMNVLYVPDGDVIGKIKSLNTTQDFNHAIDVRGAESDMQVSAEAELESFDYSLINSRKINLRCTAGIGIKVTKPAILDISTDVEDVGDIEINREKLRVISSLTGAECQIILREQLDLPIGKPAIGEILRLTAVPSSVELCMMENKAVAKGQVRLCTLYCSEGDDGSIQFMEHTIPFTEILDVDGAVEDMEGDIEYIPSDMYFEVRDDSDGEPRILGIELVLTAVIRGSEILELQGLSDAYSLRGAVNLATKTYRLEQLLDNNTAQIAHKVPVQVPPMLPGISQVCDIASSAKVDRIAVEGEQITAHGTVHSAILYLTDDEKTPVCSFTHTSEFSQSFMLPAAGPDTACDAKVFVDHTSYTLNGNDGLDLRCIISLALKALKTGEVTLVDEIILDETASEQNCPCMVIYFVQKGDTLWDIAKRYRTTVEDIMKTNQLDSDKLMPGQQIKLCRRTAASLAV